MDQRKYKYEASKQMKKLGLVCTTIGDGSFLEAYCNKAEEEGLKQDVSFYIAPDHKSPKELFDAVHVQQMKGFDVKVAWSCRANHDMEQLIPFDSDNRRNIGYLRALEDDCSLVSIQL
jgi:hypothetical protein